jgi:hypothetical protein
LMSTIMDMIVHLTSGLHIHIAEHLQTQNHNFRKDLNSSNAYQPLLLASLCGEMQLLHQVPTT